MIATHPLTGVGPEHGAAALRSSTAIRWRSSSVNPHLHNVPMQIAAERGLPALAALAVVHRRAAADLRAAASRHRALPLATAAARPAWSACSTRGPLRVQLRRLRVPDAVPRARHAALRRRRAPTCHERSPQLTDMQRGTAPGRSSLALRRPPVLVVGDVMLDQFIVGRVERISPEAPVPIVRVRSRGVPPRRRRQRRPQHRGPRRARRRSSG